MDLRLVSDGTAASCFKALTECLEELGLHIKRMAGFGSDGASTMVGRLNGVAAQLKAQNPNVQFTHCIAPKKPCARRELLQSLQRWSTSTSM